MKTCLTCGVQFEGTREAYCSKTCYQKAYRQNPRNKRRNVEFQRKFLNARPEKKAQRLEQLLEYNRKKADDAFDHVVNPRCEIDGSYCNPDTEGRGKCGDVAEGCIWNSFRQKDPRQAVAQSG